MLFFVCSIDPGPWRFLKILKNLSQSENYRVVKGGVQGQGVP